MLLLTAYRLFRKGLTMAKARRAARLVRVDVAALYSPRQAALALGMNPRTITRAILAGTLKAHRPTENRCFIRGADLLGWLTGTLEPAPRDPASGKP